MWGLTTYYNFKVNVQAYPGGAGTVYVRSHGNAEISEANRNDEIDPDPFNKEGKEGFFGSAVDPEEENVTLAITNNEKNIFVRPTAKAGYSFVGFVEKCNIHSVFVSAAKQPDNTVDDSKWDVSGMWKIDTGITRGGHSDSQAEGQNYDNNRGWRETRYTTGQTYSMPTEVDKTYYALFKVPAGYFFDYASGQNPGNCGTIGSISADKENVNWGDELTLTASPKPGNYLLKWSKKTDSHENEIDVYSTEPSITITATEGEYYVPTFAASPISIGTDGIVTYSNAKSVRVSDEDFANYKFYPAKIVDGKVTLLTTAGLNGVPDSDGDPHGAIVLGTPKTSVNLTWNSDMGELGYYNAFSEYDPKLKFDDDELKATAHGPITADGSQYVLGKKDGVVRFYRVKSGATIPANKAYITIAGGAKEFLDFSDDDNTTAIANMIEMRMDENQGFNLQGQRVDNNYRGIIVKNGKKYINK